MAQLFIACTRCGEPLPVDSEAIRNAIVLGDELSAAHDVCPGEEPPAEVGEEPVLRRFRAQVILMEMKGDRNDVDVPFDSDVEIIAGADVEILAGVGHTVEGRNFAEAVNGPLTTWLNQTWPKMQESAAFADLPTTSGT